MDLKCETCDFWLRHDKNHGECHRYPPTPGWPVVSKNTFCGGHTGMPKTPTPQTQEVIMKPNKLKTVLFVVLTAVLIGGLAHFAFADNTITYDNGTINIVPDGSTDFKWTELTGAPAWGILVYSIQFNPSAANDRIKVRRGSTGGVITWDTNPAGSTAPLIKYFPQGERIKLVIADADCTYTTPANAQIIIETGDNMP